MNLRGGYQETGDGRRETGDGRQRRGDRGQRINAAFGWRKINKTPIGFLLSPDS
jgi:hypothetical protein